MTSATEGLDLSFVQVDGGGEENATVKQTDVLDMSFLEPTDNTRHVLGTAAARKQQEAADAHVDRETRATQELPEMAFSGLLSNAPLSEVMKISPAILTATNPREIGDILSSNFDYIGITEDEKGNLIANNNQTGVQAVINKPGASALDVLQTVGIISAFMPSASLAGAALGTIPKAIVGGTSAGLTQGVIESLQKEAGGEFNEEEMAIATFLGGASEVVMPVIQALRQSRLHKQASASGQQVADVADSVHAAEEASESSGIRLFPAQKTQIPSELEKQSFIPQLPAGTAKASKELRLQNQEAADAVDEFLKMLAPDESVVTGPAKFRTAAEDAITAAKETRKARTSPLYRGAFKVGADVDLKPVNDLIESELKKFPEGGEIGKTLLKVKRFLSSADSLERLHGVKLEIDQMINSRGKDAIGNTTKGKLMEIKKTLLGQIEDDAASPLYRQARLRFEAESPAVNRVESLVGKVSELDDTQLKVISRKIFDPAETNPEIIKQAKKVIQDIDPSAWDELVRNEIERRMGSIRSNANPATTENIPNQLYNAIFGSKKQRDVLFNAVDGEVRKNLAILEVALGRARLGRVAGSPTSGREEIKQELKGGFRAGVQDFFAGPTSSISGGISAVATGKTADASFDARVRALADLLFDPKWTPRLRELRKLDPDSPALARASAQLLDDAFKGASESLSIGTDDLPDDTQNNSP